jgi:hypothetical protein
MREREREREGGREGESAWNNKRVLCNGEDPG